MLIAIMFALIEEEKAYVFSAIHIGSDEQAQNNLANIFKSVVLIIVDIFLIEVQRSV